MKPELKLSVILPSYQEGENLKLLLPGLKRAAAAVSPAYEVIVVDTCQPKDDTAEVCREHQVRYVPRRGGDSFGDAVRTGIEAAQGEWTVFMDADGSHSPEMIPKLARYADDYDVVIASRYVQGGRTENSRALVLMSRLLNLVYVWVLKLNCRDVSNSFKLYRTAQLKAIPLRCNNFDIVEEILVKIQRLLKTVRIKEVPFTFERRKAGKTKRNLVTFILTYAFTLVRLRWSA